MNSEMAYLVRRLVVSPVSRFADVLSRFAEWCLVWVRVSFRAWLGSSECYSGTFLVLGSAR